MSFLRYRGYLITFCESAAELTYFFYLGGIEINRSTIVAIKEGQTLRFSLLVRISINHEKRFTTNEQK